MTFKSPYQVSVTNGINFNPLNMLFVFNENKGWHNACNKGELFY